MSGVTYNSRRNISLGTAGVFMGINRPHTAALGGGGLPRPPTAAFKNRVPGGVLGATTLPNAFNG
jgi:hypothetical protein